jgi:hypothetical protein
MPSDEEQGNIKGEGFWSKFRLWIVTPHLFTQVMKLAQITSLVLVVWSFFDVALVTVLCLANKV